MRFLVLLALLTAPMSAQSRIPIAPRDGSFFGIDQVDKFTGTATLSTKPTRLSDANFRGGFYAQTELTFDRMVTKGADTLFAITLRLVGNDWTFIEHDEPSLIFLLNNDSTIGLKSASTPRRDVIRSSQLQEFSIYPISAKDLFRLARADRVDYRIVGSRRNIDGYAQPKNFTRLRTLLATAFPDSALYEVKQP